MNNIINKVNLKTEIEASLHIDVERSPRHIGKWKTCGAENVHVSLVENRSIMYAINSNIMYVI